MLMNTLGTWVVRTWWEPIGNIMGTHWEPGKNEKNSFPLPPPLQNLKGKESKPPWVHAWAFPLVAWNFSSQKSLTLFLAWAKTPCKEHPTYLPISAMGGGKSSCCKFYNPQLQTMFNALRCPASPFIPAYYYKLHKRILQSVLSTALLYKQTNIAKCIWPFPSGALLLSLTKILWTTLVHRYIGTWDLQQTRKKGARWVVMTLKQGKEGRKNTGSCCGSIILLLLLVWLLPLVDLAPFLSILASHTHIVVGVGRGG
jgi:hypothetical protein